jgi:hypothetical protein
MDNPNPDATTDVDPAEPDARRRRDAGLPTNEKEPTSRQEEEKKKNIVRSHENEERDRNDQPRD